uniref:Uncharacterized protein n=1 Tax=Arundo donax TaxID=35708 RepID=A0A0A9E8I1_ARUDO
MLMSMHIFQKDAKKYTHTLTKICCTTLLEHRQRRTKGDVYPRDTKLLSTTPSKVFQLGISF